MFFVLSKLAWLVTQPLNLVFLLVAGGALLANLGKPAIRATGRLLAGAGALAFVATGFTQLPDYLLDRLERLAPQGEFPADIAGIVVLGGGLDADAAAAGRPGWDGYRMGDSAERLVHALKLAREYPRARLVFTGGIADIAQTGATEAQAARAAIEAIGGSADRAEFDGDARNTAENAANVRALAAGDSDRPWLLVTSAFHMPRALGAFHKAGMKVIAAPTDFRADPVGWPYLAGNAAAQFAKAGTWLHEAIGLLAYRLSGRI
jgi:uncharacterized SAM-binding protein YcdF (DUF218 family)